MRKRTYITDFFPPTKRLASGTVAGNNSASSGFNAMGAISGNDVFALPFAAPTPFPGHGSLFDGRVWRSFNVGGPVPFLLGYDAKTHAECYIILDWSFKPQRIVRTIEALKPLVPTYSTTEDMKLLYPNDPDVFGGNLKRLVDPTRWARSLRPGTVEMDGEEYAAPSSQYLILYWTIKALVREYADETYDQFPGPGDPATFRFGYYDPISSRRYEINGLELPFFRAALSPSERFAFWTYEIPEDEIGSVIFGGNLMLNNIEGVPRVFLMGLCVPTSKKDSPPPYVARGGDMEQEARGV